MSQLTMFAVTNYFQVKDPDVFRAATKEYEVKVLEKTSEDGSIKFRLIGNDGDTGDFPDRLAVSDELYGFAHGAVETFKFHQQDVASLTDEALLKALEDRCELLGYTASGDDMEDILALIRADDIDDVEIDFGKRVARHLAEGQVMVMTTVGAQGSLRGVQSAFGFACALNSAGECVSIDLNSIVAEASKAFGVDVAAQEH